MDLISSVAGSTLAAITKDARATVVDVLTKEVIARIALKKDTGTRISFDRNLNRFILGSWSGGIDCFELDSTKKLWHNGRSGFAYANIIDRSSELYVVGLKDDPNGCSVLDLESGAEVRYLKHCGSLMAKSDVRIGLNPIQKTLLIFDANWGLMGSPEWKCFGLWSFACDDSGIIIVSGPSGYAGSFAANIETAIAEVEPHEHFFRIESICWNKKNRCFFAIVSEFEGKAERALIALDHTLKSFDVIRRFPLSSREVICDDRYLVAENGFVFDLDIQRECDSIDWAVVLNGTTKN